MAQLNPFAELISAQPNSLSLPLARDLAGFLDSGLNPFARLKHCRVDVRNGDVIQEVVVLEVDVERSQQPVHDIRHRESLAVIFRADAATLPEVQSLRVDFPMVPHLVLGFDEFPRVLCLYDLPFHEVMLDWTAPGFVEHIREWLAQTAEGQLHREDQPLEPLFLGPTSDLVVDPDLLRGNQNNTKNWCPLKIVPSGHNIFTAVAVTTFDDTSDQDGFEYVAMHFTSSPQTHGVVRQMPRTLAELHDLLAVAGLDLIDQLRHRLKNWLYEPPVEIQRMLQHRLILVLLLPKKRRPNDEIETVELAAFALFATIRDLGEALGVWDIQDGQPGLLIQVDRTKHGDGTSLWPLNPKLGFSRFRAALMNGLAEPDQVLITAVGVGALGSQTVTNLIRSGFGQWTLIDGDVVSPHNMSRHALFGFAVGYPKSTTLASELNDLIEGEEVAQGIVTNVLEPEEKKEEINRAFADAEIILDMSASVAVARHLSRDVNSDARRVSLFLNPSGTALTLLAEDKTRRIPLDVLEMQFYRAIASDENLNGLLNTGSRLRTGRSCRDVSSLIPQDLVALHSAIGSRAIRKTRETSSAEITTWRIDQQSWEVSATHVPSCIPLIQSLGNWTVYTDSYLIERLENLRADRLPNETGGVLIGAWDMQRKILYVVDALPSPSDSDEWPNAYIRGTDGLDHAVTRIRKSTQGMLDYLGEWHSHPDGFGTSASSDDGRVLAWLRDTMEQSGKPGIMAIVGDNNMLTLYLDNEEATIRA